MSPAAQIPRLRMFAGPNGSGKSTLLRRLQALVSRPDIFGVYLNRALMMTPNIVFYRYQVSFKWVKA